jgi:hypothetical protein
VIERHGLEFEAEPARSSRPDRPAGAGARAVARVGRLPDLRELSEKVGNRQVSRLIRDAHESGSALRVARAPAAAALPVLSDAAAKVLSELGVTDAQMAAFRAGELIAFQMPVPGSDPTIGLLQLQRRLVRGGIFDINVPTDADAALKSFFRARGVVLRVAKAVDAPEIELIGASVRNEKIEQMLIRQKFTRTAELIPESAGLGPSDTVEIYTKRFLVHGATADTAPGGSGAPPADPAPPAVLLHRSP